MNGEPLENDVGLLLAAQSEPQKSANLFTAAGSGKFQFTDVEQRVFGFDHCELGERLSQAWKFPEYVSSVTRWHHNPAEAPEEFKAVCRHVYIADTQCCATGTGFPLTCVLQEVSDETLEQSHLSREIVTEVTNKLPILLRLHLN